MLGIVDPALFMEGPLYTLFKTGFLPTFPKPTRKYCTQSYQVCHYGDVILPSNLYPRCGRSYLCQLMTVFALNSRSQVDLLPLKWSKSSWGSLDTIIWPFYLKFLDALLLQGWVKHKRPPPTLRFSFHFVCDFCVKLFRSGYQEMFNSSEVVWNYQVERHFGDVFSDFCE